MKIVAIRKKSTADLQKNATELRQKIVESRKSRILGEETNHNTTSNLRRELARTLTILSEKEKQNV